MKVSIVTLGCPKNEVDSWIMRSHLAREGFELVDLEDAEVVIVNTCGFIREAKEESIDTILEVLERGKRVYVAGCLYQRYGEELVKSLPEVSGWISLGQVRDVASILRGEGKRCILPAVLPEVRDFSFIAPVSFVYVKVAEGCSNRCNYCAIPSIRGAYRSRSVASILDEIRYWLDMGAREIILISQDTALYGKDIGVERGLLTLLEGIEGMEGDFWVRLMYLHPAHLDKRVVEFVAESDRFVKYLEVPFQHVSERVLSLMGREGGRRAVERVVEWAEEFGIFLRTTFLVGHPGEKERDFEELISFIEEVRPWRFSVFGYSPEEGTPSYFMEQLPEEVVAERVSEITQLQDRILYENSLELVGKRLRAIVDGDGTARIFAMAPDIDGILVLEDEDAPPGSFVDVMIEDAIGVDLVGRPL